MKLWQVYTIVGILFSGVFGSALVSYKIEESTDSLFKQIVLGNKSTEVLAADPAVKGDQTQDVPSLIKGRLQEEIATFSAQAVILGNIRNGEILASKEAEKPLAMASLTKIMTAFVALEKLPLSQEIIVSKHCASLPKDNQQLGLKSGQKVSVEDLLYGLLVRSGSDCACVLSEAFNKEEELVELMNKKANVLGLTATHFQNPVGNDAIDNFTTVKDVFKLSREAMKNQIFRKIVGTNYYWGMQNTNELLFSKTGVTGIKTGYTPGAGECLAASWVAGGEEYLAIVLASDDRFGEVGRIIDKINTGF